MQGESTKRCRVCEEVKPASAFSKDRKSKDRLQGRCKACYKVYYTENHAAIMEQCRVYRQKTAEVKRENDRKYRVENAERIAEYKRAYYRKNRERLLAESNERKRANRQQASEVEKAWRKANPERCKASARRYREKHPEKMFEYRSRYRANLRGAEGDHTDAEILQMYDDQQGLCAYCDSPLFGMFHVDHMVPLSRGGRNDWTNLAVACPSCNVKKYDLTVEEFIAGVPRRRGVLRRDL